jgi:hypothetical protein
MPFGFSKRCRLGPFHAGKPACARRKNALRLGTVPARGGPGKVTASGRRSAAPGWSRRTAAAGRPPRLLATRIFPPSRKASADRRSLGGGWSCERNGLLRRVFGAKRPDPPGGSTSGVGVLTAKHSSAEQFPKGITFKGRGRQRNRVSAALSIRQEIVFARPTMSRVTSAVAANAG